MHGCAKSANVLQKWCLAIMVRHGSSWKKKIIKREELKEQVVQYVGENVTRTDRMYVWGLAATGALGVRSYLQPEVKQKLIKIQSRPARLKFVDVNEMKIKTFACGYGFTLLVVKHKSSLKVLGMGMNTDSQLGYQEVVLNTGKFLSHVIVPSQIQLPLLNPSSTNIVDIDGGRAHTLIATDKEGVFSLGNNAHGQCGRPIVDTEKYEGSQTVNKLLDLPSNVTKVVCGQDHSLFLTDTGEVYACGLGSDGQTGLGTFKTVSQPTKVKGDIDGIKITHITGSSDCILAVSKDGDLFGWGNSEYNQLALVSSDTQVSIPRHISLNCGKVVKAATGGSICGILNSKGEVFTWGFGNLGQGPEAYISSIPTRVPDPLFGLNEIDTEKKVTNLVCGLNHFAAVTNRGELYTWGKNKYGVLGLGHPNDQYFPLKVAMPAEVVSVHCGVDHTVAWCKSF